MDQLLRQADVIEGCILGMAVGDALGLPYEGVSPRRVARMLGPPDRHRFAFGRGIISDDTEHAVLVADSFAVGASDVEQFRLQLRRRLRNWLLTLPPGVGLATLKACLKMCVTPSHWSTGIFSAGNGPAMRAPILGVVAKSDEHLCQLVKASTELTHLDPKACYGALVIALAARESAGGKRIDTEHFLGRVNELLPDDAPANELRELLVKAADLSQYETPVDFAAAMFSTKGVSGYIYETVPFVIHCWLRHSDDYATAIQQAILAGGDADTTAAILGGLIGANVGTEGIPSEWLAKTWLWPITRFQIQSIAKNISTLDSHGSEKTKSELPSMGASLLRNLLVIPLILAHGFRRLVPPY